MESRISLLEARVSALFSLLSRITPCLREIRKMTALYELALEQGGITIQQSSEITGSEKKASRLLRSLQRLGFLVRRGDIFLPAVRLKGRRLAEEIVAREFLIDVERLKKRAEYLYTC